MVGASRGCGGAQLCPRPPSTGSQAWQPVGGIRPHGGIHPARTRTGTRRERERLCGHATRRPRRFRVRAGTCFIARPMSFPSGRMCACRQPHRGQSGTGVAGPCDQTTFLTILARPPKRSPPQNPGRCSRWFEGQFVPDNGFEPPLYFEDLDSTREPKRLHPSIRSVGRPLG